MTGSTFRSRLMPMEMSLIHEEERAWSSGRFRSIVTAWGRRRLRRGHSPKWSEVEPSLHPRLVIVEFAFAATTGLTFW